MNYVEKKWNPVLTHQIGGGNGFESIQELLNKIIKTEDYDHNTMIEVLTLIFEILEKYNEDIYEKIGISIEHLNSFKNYLRKTKSNEEIVIKELQKQSDKESHTKTSYIVFDVMVTAKKLNNFESPNLNLNRSYKNIQIWEYISKLINEQSEFKFYPWSVDLNLNVEIDSTERLSIIERNTEQYKITIKLHPYQNNEHLNGKNLTAVINELKDLGSSITSNVDVSYLSHGQPITEETLKEKKNITNQ